jgi:hypothetical protein
VENAPCVFANLVALGRGHYPASSSSRWSQCSSIQPIPASHHRISNNVQRVVDGDTLVLGTGERVRLIGVDTPETKHPNKPVEYFGKKASAFTKRMAEGKRIRLEYDQANAHLWSQRPLRAHAGLHFPGRRHALKRGDNPARLRPCVHAVSVFAHGSRGNVQTKKFNQTLAITSTGLDSER